MTANYGKVSIVTGRRQARALRLIAATAGLLGGLGALSENNLAATAGVVAIVLIAVTPLLRVGWLTFRWLQERDWRFVRVGAALLVVIAVGAVASLFFVGS